MKPQLFGLACDNGQKDCLEKSKRFFREWLKDEKKSIPPVLRTIVYKWGNLR